MVGGSLKKKKEEKKKKKNEETRGKADEEHALTRNRDRVVEKKTSKKITSAQEP